MRPGNRWEKDSASPLAATMYGVIVSLVLACGLSYLAELLGSGVVAGAGTWHTRQALLLAALNLYACQHVTLIGSGTLPEMGRVHATVNLPLTLWALVPALSLFLGGLTAARSRASRGRWGKVGPAIASGVLYAVILSVAARFVSATFASAALPAVSAPGMNTEFNPLNIPFRPSSSEAFGYGCLFGVLFCYLGALCTVREGRGGSAGKWWACAKAVVVVALVMQLIVAIAVGVWLGLGYGSKQLDNAARAKYIQLMPTATGAAYALVFAGNVSYSAVPAAMPSASRSTEINLYSGTTSKEGSETTHRPPWRFAWVIGLIGALMVLATGRLAVKYGSRDGSLPTAIRVALFQAIYFWILTKLCWMGWGVSGQFALFAGPTPDSALFFSAAGIFVLALIGAHRANLRFAGPLSGFPAV